ncbi:MAG: D-alanyl-lipoteichoic acid biosynthesis protein DltD [Herpetosiphon sp.]
MKHLHLLAGMLVIFLVLGTAFAWESLTRRLEQQAIHTPAPAMFDQKLVGVALQTAALNEPDLLPIFGSSELQYPNLYHGSNLFHAYPTGFTLFPVGKEGTSVLNTALDLAALGPALHGKKLVISLSPLDFMQQQTDPGIYAGNFSHLHAQAALFNPQLSMSLKQGLAAQMQRYPATLVHDPLLNLVASDLAKGRATSRLLYGALVPLGRLSNAVARLQDHWETRLLISRYRRLLTPEQRIPAALDWPALLVQAEHEYATRANNNPWGIDNLLWTTSWSELAKKHQATRPYGSPPASSHEWTDLELLLRVLVETGAKPLLLSMPIHADYAAYTGMPSDVQSRYSQRLHDLALQYHVRLVDFADHGHDNYFMSDPFGHLSDKGWVAYDQAMDAFVHGTLR